MPPLNQLPPARLTLMGRVGLAVLRAYLLIAGNVLLLRLIRMAIPGQTGA